MRIVPEIPQASLDAGHRRQRIELATVIGLVLAMFIRGPYLARAPWFTQHGNALALLVLAGTAACAAASLVSGVWLPSRARSHVRTLLPAGDLNRLGMSRDIGNQVETSGADVPGHPGSGRNLGT